MNDMVLDSISYMTISSEQVEKIKSRLPEFHRVSQNIGQSHSQTSYSIQTLSSFNSPIQKMKQCIIQIDRRYSALREAYYSIEQKKLDIKKLRKENSESSILKSNDLETQIDETSKYMEIGLRELGMFQDMYDDIKKNNNIPDNWGESELEEQEIQHMIKSAFTMSIQNMVSHGSIDRGTFDYFTQLGINPIIADYETGKYITSQKEKIIATGESSILDQYSFVDEMAEKFKDEYKLSLDRSGLKNIGSKEFRGN